MRLASPSTSTGAPPRPVAKGARRRDRPAPLFALSSLLFLSIPEGREAAAAACAYLPPIPRTPPPIRAPPDRRPTTTPGRRRRRGTDPSASSSSSGTALPCQLLGMNCARPTDFNFSFRGFARRGGCTDVHSDGWGLAFYEGRGLRAFHDPNPASDSPIADLVSHHPIKTLNMIAHIRYATVGEKNLENVHPFQREMWGIQWCFAHNGDVPLFKKSKRGENPPWLGDAEGEQIYNPVGDTDSEAIFCALLNALKAKFDTLPSIPVLHDTLNKLCREIVDRGSDGGRDNSDDPTILNFLLGCGERTQFAYSWPGSRPGSDVWNGLHYIVREPPFGVAHLSDCDYSVDFSELNTDDDRVAVVATQPLTNDEEWIELTRGELILFDDGLPHRAPEECFRVEFEGHGLESDVMPRRKNLLEEDMRRYRFRRSFFEAEGI